MRFPDPVDRVLARLTMWISAAASPSMTQDGNSRSEEYLNEYKG
jgi:hypothetical protein